MKIVVADDASVPALTIPDGEVERLRSLFPDVTIVRARTPEMLRHELRDADGAFSSVFEASVFAAAPQLRWIHSSAAGITRLLTPEIVASDIILTNSRGALARPIAEYVIAMTLMFFRRLHIAARRQMAHVWARDDSSQPPGMRLLADSHLAIVGLGATGVALATLSAALSMRVRAIRRHAGTDGSTPPSVERVHAPAALPELLAWADVVVLSVPLTAETRGLIGARELRQMKRDALLVNIGRGELIKEQDLIDELARGTIGGAALDVLEKEPLEPMSPLWDLENMIITPHVAGLLPDYWTVTVDLFADNLRRFLAGQPLNNVVDKTAGY